MHLYRSKCCINKDCKLNLNFFFLLCIHCSHSFNLNSCFLLVSSCMKDHGRSRSDNILLQVNGLLEIIPLYLFRIYSKPMFNMKPLFIHLHFNFLFFFCGNITLKLTFSSRDCKQSQDEKEHNTKRVNSVSSHYSSLLRFPFFILCLHVFVKLKKKRIHK